MVHTTATAIFFRCDSEFFPEDTVKVGNIVEAAFQCDACDRKRGLCQLACSYFQTILIQVFDTGHIHMTLEKTHEMVFAEMAEICHFPDGNGLLIIFMNKLQDCFQLIGNLCMLQRLVLERDMRSKQKKQVKKYCFDFQFISGRLFRKNSADLFERLQKKLCCF